MTTTQTQQLQEGNGLNGRHSNNNDTFSRYYFVRSLKKLSPVDFKRDLESIALQRRRLEALIENGQNYSHEITEIDLSGFEVKEISKEKIPSRKRGLIKVNDHGIHCIVKGTKKDFSSLEGYLIRDGLDIEIVRDSEGKTLKEFKTQETTSNSVWKNVPWAKLTDPFYVFQKALAVTIVAACGMGIVGGYSLLKNHPTNKPSQTEGKDGEITGATYSFSTEKSYEQKVNSTREELCYYINNKYPSIIYHISSPNLGQGVADHTWKEMALLKGTISGGVSEVQEIKKYVETGLSLAIDKGAINYLYRKNLATNSVVKIKENGEKKNDK